MPAPNPASSVRVIAWPPWARVLAALLNTVAFGNLLFIATLLILDAFEGELRAPPAAVTYAVFFLSALPRLLVALLRWCFAGTLTIAPDHWLLSLRSTRIELPVAAIADVVPWRVALPGPGQSIRLASGRTFSRQLEGTLPDATAHGRSARFASARARFHRSDVPAYLVKFLLFPSILVAILFRAHQVITFGSPLGQWNLMGPGAWARGLLMYGLATLAHLLVIAGVLRVAAELLALLGTAALPRSAIPIRRIAEWFVRSAYYVAIPALIGFAFLR